MAPLAIIIPCWKSDFKKVLHCLRERNRLCVAQLQFYALQTINFLPIVNYLKDCTPEENIFAWLRDAIANFDCKFPVCFENVLHRVYGTNCKCATREVFNSLKVLKVVTLTLNG